MTPRCVVLSVSDRAAAIEFPLFLIRLACTWGLQRDPNEKHFVFDNAFARDAAKNSGHD
jgi:hypothetical protein